jgi:hypothetical protein
MKILQMNDKGLLEPANETLLQTGQIFWLNGYGQNQYSHDRKAIYEMVTSPIGNLQYKWVNLDKPERGIKTAHEIRHASKIFGIGSYYNDNDFATQEEITNALQLAIDEELRLKKLREENDAINQEISENGRKIIEANMPSFTPKGFIIAEYEKDESDSMTDYYGSRTQKAGWILKKYVKLALTAILMK